MTGIASTAPKSMASRQFWHLLLTVLLLLLCLSDLADSQCTNGAVRLVRSYSYRNYGANVGTIQVCSLGQWGSVCGYSSTNFGPNEARVICRQLGYSDRGATYRTRAPYGTASGSILLVRGLDCIGNETSWLQCNLQPLSTRSSCSSHSYDAGVQCSLAPTLQVSITTVPSLVNGIFLAGTSLSMSCNVLPYATGIETYHWTSNCTGDCFIRGTSDSMSTIQRDLLRIDDSGRHTCTVRRGISTASASIAFTVVEPEVSTVISPPFSGLDSPPYEHFTLWCNATTSSRLRLPTTITWYKDGITIDSSMESETMIIEYVPRCSVQNCSALIVNDALTSFSGEYKCVASILMPDSHTISSSATTSVVIQATSEAIIQLHLMGVQHCKEWVFIEAHEKVADINEKLSAVIHQGCDCDFPLHRITESGLVCSEYLNKAVYQSRLLATPLVNSSTLVHFITQFVNEKEQTLVVRGLRLGVVPNCTIETDSFSYIKCGGDTTDSPPATVTAHSSVSASSSSSANSSVVAIAEGVVIILILSIAILSCLLCLVAHRRKSNHFTRLTERSDVSFERESGVTISGTRHFRPMATNQAIDDIYEEVPLKPDKSEDSEEK